MRVPAPLPALVGALALTLPLAVVACGSDEAESPLDAALGYLPSSAPMVAAVTTDPDDAGFQALDQLVDRFPGGAQVAENVLGTVLPAGLDFEDEIAPLLGNELVVGAPDAQELGEGGFVAAIQAPDIEAAERLAEAPGVSEVGEAEGATLYGVEGGVLAIDEDVVLFADTQKRLEAALAQRAEEDGSLDQQIFDEALADLPEDAPVRVYADAPAILAAVPEVQQARSVAWIAALQTLGIALSPEGDRLGLELDLATDPAGLTDADLPLAATAGEDPPRVIARPGELGIGIREPGQTLLFAKLVADALAPGGAELVESQLGIGVEELARQLGDEAFVSLGLERGSFLRADLKDSQAFQVALARIARVLPLLTAAVGLEGLALDPVDSPLGDFYELRTPGAPPTTIGVVGQILVVTDNPAQAAVTPVAPRMVPGVEGSVVVAGHGKLLLEQALSPLTGLLGAPLVDAFLQPIGDVQGSLETDTTGIRGSFQLDLE